MNESVDVRRTVSKTYTRAVEENPAAGRSCCGKPVALAAIREGDTCSTSARALTSTCCSLPSSRGRIVTVLITKGQRGPQP